MCAPHLPPTQGHHPTGTPGPRSSDSAPGAGPCVRVGDDAKRGELRRPRPHERVGFACVPHQESRHAEPLTPSAAPPGGPEAGVGVQAPAAATGRGCYCQRAGGGWADPRRPSRPPPGCPTCPGQARVRKWVQSRPGAWGLVAGPVALICANQGTVWVEPSCHPGIRNLRRDSSRLGGRLSLRQTLGSRLFLCAPSVASITSLRSVVTCFSPWGLSQHPGPTTQVGGRAAQPMKGPHVHFPFAHAWVCGHAPAGSGPWLSGSLEGSGVNVPPASAWGQ